MTPERLRHLQECLNDLGLSDSDCCELFAYIGQLTAESPKWMDRPSGPGLWLTSGNPAMFLSPVMMHLDETDLARGAPFHCTRVYGPIPVDVERA